MRIGIMTFWWSNDNYGQLLQCYALQKYLRDAGHDAYLIRYDASKDRATPLHRKLGKALSPVKLARYVRRTSKGRRLVQENARRGFDDFRNKYIVQSEHLYSCYQQLRENPPEADCYIVGSDQVWNFSFYGSSFQRKMPLVHAYMLDFGAAGTRRMSYAASWSVASLDERIVTEIEPLLSRFDFVSVREEQGMELCRQCGRDDSRWVCDPTLLVAAEKYRSLYRVERASPPVGGKYLFLYMLANPTDFDIQRVYDFASERGLEVVYVTGNGVLDKREKHFATIPGWLSLVDNAEYVVTNSFHCCVFSSLFGTRFGVVRLTGRMAGMNTRLESLFRQLELEPRWVGDDFAVLDKKKALIERRLIKAGKEFLDSLNTPPPLSLFFFLSPNHTILLSTYHISATNAMH